MLSSFRITRETRSAIALAAFCNLFSSGMRSLSEKSFEPHSQSSLSSPQLYWARQSVLAMEKTKRRNLRKFNNQQLHLYKLWEGFKDFHSVFSTYRSLIFLFTLLPKLICGWGWMFDEYCRIIPLDSPHYSFTASLLVATLPVRNIKGWPTSAQYYEPNFVHYEMSTY